MQGDVRPAVRREAAGAYGEEGFRRGLADVDAVSLGEAWAAERAAQQAAKGGS
ncbi:hypothetical protein FHR81_003426 [Actinoalloteichus hoggarensis]|uniref:Uncharacterized protein n=1 Tax=Actinoalloteichus hoggarensis TaxID=1470176 RepID=A0A221W8V4_9PSEU|nr:hypothetical protein [Actinoalloteichus hoggarensis]ASO21777.1 hypothetical protein AHOG_20800 [Actinoalloteichus hoggarensis]MBB5922374.1 hypothetical protein [Actinoalloteichus hoggarensis]